MNYKSIMSENFRNDKNTEKQEESFKCNKCDYETKVKKYLDGHRIKHTGQYQCLEGCKVSFKTISELDLHIQIRHGGRIRPTEFNCEECESTFISHHFLWQLIDKKHTNGRTSCDKFGIICESKHQLSKHLQSSLANFQTVNT